MHRVVFIPLLCAVSGFCATPVSVGSGAPNVTAQQSFLFAYNRNLFYTLVSQPTTDVRSFGSSGLVQEFPSKTGSSLYALVNPDPTLPFDSIQTFQVYSDIYSFYNSLGVSVIGYPVNDTTACPRTGFGVCNYQVFTRNYALFSYPGYGLRFSVRDPIFSVWTKDGGVPVMGSATSAELAVTSASGVQGTEQTFSTGTVFSYPAGSSAASTFGISDPFSTVYINSGGYSRLGFPTAEAAPPTSTGLIRQTFEKGRIEMTPGGDPTVLFSVASVGIVGQAQGLSLSLGASAALNSYVFDVQNQLIAGRTLSWSTSNGNVARVVGNGPTATVQAVGFGSANIYVSVEGVVSQPLLVRVSGGCCTVGEGAPSAAVSQAFQTAVQRNHISVLNAGAPVSRVGNGYTQIVQAADGSSILLAEADDSSVAYALSGPIAAAYAAMGGFTGPLGFPVSDAANGAQRFANGAALAGSPVRVVPPSIATKWFQLSGPSGVLGQPAADAATSQSAAGLSVLSQAFTGGAIFAASKGAFYSAGPILARYVALAGPAGSLGLPLSDLQTNGSAQTQTFEGGYIDLAPGASVAVEHLNPRHPALTVTPSVAVPGGHVHIAATGFAPGASLAFTITGQPGFSVTTATGSFSWDLIVPSNATAGTVSVKATAQSDSAAASYNVTSIAASRPVFAILSGDKQVGLPGSVLAVPIVAALRDASGNPLAGVPVSLDSSAGPAATNLTTDADGLVSVPFRLPLTAGVAVGSLKAGTAVVNFSAAAAGRVLDNFPAFSELDNHGALTASLAGLLRYAQNTGALPLPNGLATPANVAQFVASANGVFSPAPGTSIPDPWIATRFAAAGLSLEDASLPRIRDLLNTGSPVALLLNLTADGTPIGSDTVDAIGVADDGSIVISDPNPAFARTSLNDYATGFTAFGHNVLGTVVAALRVTPLSVPPGAQPFTVATPLASGASTSSALGACASLDVLDSATAAGERFALCDGSQSRYQLDFANAGSATFLDLSGGPAVSANTGTSQSITRTNGLLTLATASLKVDAITDSAAFSGSASPGGLITIFGAGLAGASVALNGKSLPILAAFPFQVNTQIPADAAPGSANLTVTGPLGSQAQQLMIVPAAPGIFMLGTQGAIVNQDGTLNTPNSPATRGQYVSVYCAGLGVTAPRSGLQWTSASVSVVVNGTAVASSFAGLAPGFIGLYQVNVTIPAAAVPSLTGSLALREGSQTSNSVPFALQ